MKYMTLDINKYNKDFIEAIVGLLLSGGHLRNSNITRETNKMLSKGYYKMVFTFKIWNKEMMIFNNLLNFEVLGEICTNIALNLYMKKNSTQSTFNTRSLELFTEIYPYFYKKINNKNIKQIPNDKFLQEYFSEITLAFMLMGDGYWDNFHKTVFICTECFTLSDINRLLFILRHKLGLIARTNKRGSNFRIRFSNKELNLRLLRVLVEPYLHPIMLYKLGLKNK